MAKIKDTQEQLLDIESPILEEHPIVGAKPGMAAGVPAVVSSMREALAQMGPMRTALTLSKLNHKGGFDCPSCAWPDPDDRRSLAEFCENGAKAVADEGTTKRATPEFFAAHSIVELSHQSDFELGKHGRLTHPLIKRPGATHYSPVSWNEAFDLIAKELLALETPDQASFYTSGRTSNEAAFLYQLFVRIYGTNNLPDCSNMCHESSGYGLTEQIGVGKGTVTLGDFEHADCILIAGQNPGTNHPRMLTALQKAARNGCKIISINPLSEVGLKAFANPQEVSGWLSIGTPISTLHLQVRINGDVALFKGIMKEMLAMEEAGGPGSVLDLAFIKKHTEGFEAFKKDLAAANWEDLVAESGISRELIRQTAEIAAKAKSTIACWAMGLTQHKNGVANIQAFTNLLLLRGNFGRPGAGACPVRGHSNVQGDRTMGIFEKMPEPFMDSLAKEFKFEPPRKHGFDTVATLKAMHEGQVKVFFGMGGNFLSATPDTEFTAAAMRKCRLTVHVSTKPNRAHLVTGDTALILPCLGRTERDVQASGEQFVTVEDSMSVVHSSRGNLRPGSDLLKSEPAVVAGLAKAVFKKNAQKLKLVDWDAMIANYDNIRSHIERVVPGFHDFNRRVRKPGGFYLPNEVKDHCQFLTSNSKANFMVHPIAHTRAPEGRFTLMTIRSHDQFNTTIYGVNDRYRGVHMGRRIVFMNAHDMKKHNFEKGTLVDVTSHFAGQTREAKQFFVVPYDIPTQCMAMYYPEGNVLIPIDAVAEHSNTPVYKAIEVSVRSSQA